MTELQRLLNLRGAQLPLTGLFREHTLDRVREFQRARELPVTGVVAELTKKALYQYPLDGVDWDLRTECVDLTKGAGGQCVVALQHLLNQYEAQLPDTGKYESQTTEAVRQFQRSHNLPDSGAVSVRTKEVLYAAVLPTMAPPAIYCPDSECGVYLDRATTASIADAFDKHKIATSLVTTTVLELACLPLTAKGYRTVCRTAGELLADHVITQFQQARDRHECIAISFTLTEGSFRPTGLLHAGGQRCPG